MQLSFTSQLMRLSLPVLSLLFLASCGAPDFSSEAPANGTADMAQEAAPSESSGPTGGSAALLTEASAAPKVPTRLTKRAELSLTVNSTEQAAAAVSQILQDQQGDLLSLQDQQPDYAAIASKF
ncbi:MAG: hypothetical protein HC886_16035 [Leptolyngbyaceae cyanobacterium SM1_1_3]|nr:hypothetical protein [Leptolyngbyaceae cyanobacterium SM1_1_3]